MSAKLPSVTGKQLIKVLERQGWYLKRRRGSHHYLRHPTTPDAIAVPVHGSRNVKPGLLLHIPEDGRHQPREEFQRLL